MKQLFVIVLFTISFASLSAQTESTGGFKRENILIGGALNLGAGNRSFNAGINPEVGYGIAEWLDAGLTFNLNYQTQNLLNVYPYDYKYRATNYGGGVFARIWPVNFLHIYLAQEYNWINANYIFDDGTPKYKQKFKAPSLLAGIGYGSHQRGGGYNYITIMIDLMRNEQSPYRDQNNDIVPTIRAGIGFYLKSKKK